MRTLGEICEAVSHGEQPTPDECFYAIAALQGLISMDGLAMRNSLRRGGGPAVERLWEAHFNRNKRAYAMAPKDYLGPGNDPRSEVVQRRVQLGEKLIEAAIAGKLPNQKGTTAS